ncbi:MAG: hypothetical protein JWO01_1416, partial [Microbacteriaceae bacterium]|nr:hypothetical protein [Microbacteriaceae bacterium]
MTWDPRRLPSQAGKTFVVTGGSSGIGYFICEQLADAGATVVIAARNEAKADAAIAAIRSRVPGADIRFVLLDLGSFESIRTAAGQLMQLERIDGLIENAGAIMPSKSRLETVDGSEIMFG